MAEEISRAIDENEILVRFLFQGDFKRNKPANLEYLLKKDVFLDTRSNEVSLLRERYNNEKECADRGFQTKNDLVGFVVFKKQAYLNAMNEYQKNVVSHFRSDIVSSPLDEQFKVIPTNIVVTTETPISPGHCDLVYLDPGIVNDGESTNLAVRRFSEFLFKQCKVLFLHELDDSKFSKLLN